jgi:SHS2 domain-containing protein
MEVERLVFQDLVIQVNSNQLIVEMMGVPVSVVKKAIKAVTYHNLQIHRTHGGAETEIVFDV